MKWGENSKGGTQPQELTDDSWFPFGAHGPKRNEPLRMKDVSSSYLDWLSGQPWISDWPAVEAYIARSRKAIDQDLNRSLRGEPRNSSQDEAWQPDPMDDVPF